MCTCSLHTCTEAGEEPPQHVPPFRQRNKSSVQLYTTLSASRDKMKACLNSFWSVLRSVAVHTSLCQTVLKTCLIRVIPAFSVKQTTVQIRWFAFNSRQEMTVLHCSFTWMKWETNGKSLSLSCNRLNLFIQKVWRVFKKIHGRCCCLNKLWPLRRNRCRSGLFSFYLPGKMHHFLVLFF